MLLRGLPCPLPGALVLLGLPFVILGLAGVFDAAWHTNFGLDETRWSFPHNLLGWGIALFVYGLLAARLALRAARPVPFWVMVGLGWLLLLLAGPFLGPLGEFRTVDQAVAVSRIPVLAADPDAQAALRVSIRNGLTSSNPLFLVLGPLWLGLGLGLLRRLDPRPRYLLWVAAVFTLLGFGGDNARYLDQYVPGLSEDPAVWLPAPVLPAVLAFLAVRRLRGPGAEGPAWAAAGVTAALLWLVTQRMPAWAFLLLPLSAAAAVLGARLGSAAGGLALRPTRAGILRLAATVVLAAAAAGAADLVLRTATA